MEQRLHLSLDLADLSLDLSIFRLELRFDLQILLSESVLLLEIGAVVDLLLQLFELLLTVDLRFFSLTLLILEHLALVLKLLKKGLLRLNDHFGSLLFLLRLEYVGLKTHQFLLMLLELGRAFSHLVVVFPNLALLLLQLLEDTLARLKSLIDRFSEFADLGIEIFDLLISEE